MPWNPNLDPKDIATVRIAATALVCPSPCYVYGFSVCSDTSGNGYAKVYDGHNDTGDLKYVWRIATNTSFSIQLVVPVYFRRGVYIDLVSNVESATLRFAAEHE